MLLQTCTEPRNDLYCIDCGCAVSHANGKMDQPVTVRQRENFGFLLSASSGCTAVTALPSRPSSSRLSLVSIFDFTVTIVRPSTETIYEMTAFKKAIKPKVLNSSPDDFLV